MNKKKRGKGCDIVIIIYESADKKIMGNGREVTCKHKTKDIHQV